MKAVLLRLTLTLVLSFAVIGSLPSREASAASCFVPAGEQTPCGGSYGVNPGAGLYVGQSRPTNYGCTYIARTTSGGFLGSGYDAPGGSRSLVYLNNSSPTTVAVLSVYCSSTTSYSVLFDVVLLNG